MVEPHHACTTSVLEPHHSTKHKIILYRYLSTYVTARVPSHRLGGAIWARLAPLAAKGAARAAGRRAPPWPQLVRGKGLYVD